MYSLRLVACGVSCMSHPCAEALCPQQVTHRLDPFKIKSPNGYPVGLQSGALKNELHKPDYKRLNLGVAIAALALTAVRIMHWDLQTSLGHVQTVLQGSLTGKSQIPHNAANSMTWPIPCMTTSHWHCAV